MPDIRSLLPDELKEVLKAMGEKPFRADQLFSWLHAKKALSYDEMTNLSAALRSRLREAYPLSDLRVLDCLESKLDGTRKFLFALSDDNVIESVWMKYHHGNSVCISTQAGCNMGCAFCASGIGGKVRDLTAGEMLQQVYEIERQTGERVSNVVMMGTGEPLDNYEQAVRFIRLISHEKGLNISLRNISLSTCGLVPRIYDLAKEDLAITLAVSLHAASDEKRKKLMPVAKVWSVAELIAAAKDYFAATGRRVTFEYALVKGENDSPEDAALLGKLLSGFPCHVNLIPVNPVKERQFQRSGYEEIVNFQNKLEKYGINGTIRREMGSDINGACGQLRRAFLRSGEQQG